MSNRKITAKNLTMPFAAITMATLLLLYTRTSIRAAKDNAALHREADGGQISWQKQSLRQHGIIDTPTKQHPLERGPQEAGGVGAGEKRADFAGDSTEERVRERAAVAGGRGR